MWRVAAVRSRAGLTSSGRHLRRGYAQGMLSSAKTHFTQLMREDCGTDIVVLQSTREYQVAEAAAVWVGAKAEVTRQTGKAGLNLSTSAASQVTRSIHDATFGRVAETETYKKIDEKVITPVLKSEHAQMFYFRGTLPEKERTEQLQLRRKFVEKYKSTMAPNTQETALVISKGKSKITTWYKSAMDKMGIVNRRQCIDRIMTQFPQFTENKFLFDYQTYLLPGFMRAVWDEDMEKLSKMCTAACFKLRVHPYLVQLKGYKREGSLLQVDTPMLVQAELLPLEELMVEEDAGEDPEDDEDDDFADEDKKRKKAEAKKAKKKGGKKGSGDSDSAADSAEKDKDGEKKDEEVKENLFEDEDYVSSELRKLPAITLAASTQVYEVYRDASGKVVHGNAEIAATMGHLWRVCMLPSGEWVIADVQFGSRYGMEG